LRCGERIALKKSMKIIAIAAETTVIIVLRFVKNILNVTEFSSIGTAGLFSSVETGYMLLRDLGRKKITNTSHASKSAAKARKVYS
jgi:hypothetical protein